MRSHSCKCTFRVRCAYNFLWTWRIFVFFLVSLLRSLITKYFFPARYINFVLFDTRQQILYAIMLSYFYQGQAN